MSKSVTFDYEAIVRSFSSKNAELGHLGEEKKTVLKRFQEVFKEYQRAQADLKIAEKKGRSSRFRLEQEKGALKSLEEERAKWDAKVEKKQKEIEEVQKAIMKDSLRFKHNCDALERKYHRMVTGLNNEAIVKEINKFNSNMEKLKSEMERVTLELDEIKKEPEMVEFARIPELKVLIETLDKESVQLYGEPNELKRRLKEMNANVDYLKKMIREMEQ